MTRPVHALRVSVVCLLAFALFSCGPSKSPTDLAGALNRIAAVIDGLTNVLDRVESPGGARDAVPAIDEAVDEVQSLTAIVRNLPVPDSSEKDAIKAAGDRVKSRIDRFNGVLKHLQTDHPEALDAIKDPLLSFQLALTEFSFDADPTFKQMKSSIPQRQNPPPPIGPAPRPTGHTPPPMPPEAQIPFEQRLINFRARHGDANVVLIEFTEAPDDLDFDALTSELRSVAACGNHSATRRTDRISVALAPVSDLPALAARIDWGDQTIDEISRTIRITLDPARLPPTLRQRP